MNYTTGDRRPIIVDSSKIRKTPKRDDELIKALEYFEKNTKYDPNTGTYELPPMKIVEK